ncbi:hypothetical protein PsYK624_159430 [Phanerochaete sordida]|uniref:Uncharacterized protein n=1 Tax=Phanerochaete sordida TaxID=48140 RepID=A0A9P3LMU4_9APHY|nr:hypothetical protein PsYK624_159430 [Phanerochaete sordida]
MDTLPIELHAQIFEYACADDGSAARALALVSRYVRAAAAPYRYQSLSVAGPDALAHLADTLAALPPHRRRIRRLFLSDRTHKNAVKAPTAPTQDDDCERVLHTFARVLALAAPTLECLAVLAAGPHTSTALLGQLLATPLPRLRALAAHGFYPFPHAPGVLPRLTHLRLSGNRNPHGLLELGGLAAACPALRSLHVGGLVAAATFAEEVQRALGAPADDPFARAGEEGALSPALHELALSTGPSPPNVRRHAAAAARHEKMCERLRKVAAAKQGSGMKVEVREDSVEKDMYKVLRKFVRGW